MSADAFLKGLSQADEAGTPEETDDALFGRVDYWSSARRGGSGLCFPRFCVGQLYGLFLDVGVKFVTEIGKDVGVADFQC